MHRWVLRWGELAQEILANQCSNWPELVTHTHLDHQHNGGLSLVSSLNNGLWLARTHLGLRVNVVRDGDLLLLLTLNPSLSWNRKYLRLRFILLLLLLCSRPGRQEVNYGRLNEFVNNAFRPTPELYCKRNFLKIIARLAQLMIQIVANCDKSCQFLVLPET